MHYIKFGELDNIISERADRLYQAFAAAGVDVEVPRDIHKALWEKFLLTASVGGVGAITRAPIGVIRSMPGTLRILQECMDEIFRLSRACSIALADTAVSDTMKLVYAAPEDATTSLQRDIINGKPSELEAWNGAVVRLAQEHDVPVPLHDFIYNCLLPQEQRARGLM
jgi:2-dehydropantoate 2-reductase